MKDKKWDGENLGRVVGVVGGGGMWRRKGVEDSRKTLEEAVTPI
jgi:hypothetical protein